MVTSDFRPEVQMWLFRACAMKNMQYNPYLWPNCQNFRILHEIWVEEHNGDDIFKTGSGNMAACAVQVELVDYFLTKQSRSFSLTKSIESAKNWCRSIAIDDLINFGVYH